MQPKDALKIYFGYDQFRAGQEEIINSIISGKSVLAILPTGAGKSLCYQIPALLSKSFAIVISPLIALMKDQVDSLNKLTPIASFINSSLDFIASEKVLQEVASGKIKILYISPEKLSNIKFVERLKQLSPDYVFIDEAHCISEWGHNFRPSYRRIFEFIKFAGIAKVSAFTATATEEVRIDILKQLSLTEAKVFVRGFERENLHLNVIATSRKKEKTLEILRSNKQPIIIYTATRSNAEEITEYLRKENIQSVFYHAGLSSEMKKIIQDDFMTGRVKVICATNAFGMGIDKNDIRVVIHYNMPGSIENYYQEIGRAGRDSKPSKVFLLYDNRDKNIQEYFINNSFPSREQIELFYDCICDYGNIAVGFVNTNPIPYDTDFKNLLEIKKLTSGIAQSALNVLSSSGYLQTKSELNSQHNVRFILKPNQLHSFIKSFASVNHKDLIVLLCERFGSKIFKESCRLEVGELSESLEITYSKFLNDLNELSRGGIIEYQLPHKNPGVFLTQPRIPSRRLKLILSEQSEIEKSLFQKLSIMEEYVTTEKCRMKYILKYFGQDNPNYECGKCDNCLASNKNSTLEYLNEIIIQTLHEAKRPLRTKTVVQILHSSSNFGYLSSFSTYGICVHFAKLQIEEAIQQLAVSKKILLKNDLLKLSDVSTDFFASDEIEKKNEGLINYEQELVLFNKLRQIRKEASEKFRQMPHLICQDEILRTIAKVKPKSHSELLNIAGFNQRMFNKIGEDIILVVKAENRINDTSSGFNKRALPRKMKLILELIEKEYSLKEIAELAKLSESLLGIQIEGLINMLPELNISSLIKKEEIDLISCKIKEGITDVKELKNILGGSISYAKIRLVLAKQNFN